MNPTKKTLSLWVLPNIYGRNNANLTQILPENREHFPIHFIRPAYTFISKSDRNITKVDFRLISHEHRYKNPKWNIRKPNPARY